MFDDTHRTILRLYAEGLIDAVRIDHVDGLADPRGYCRKLRRQLEAAAGHRPPSCAPSPPGCGSRRSWRRRSSLSTDWLTDGTTGYDYMNDVSAVLHDPAGEAPLTALWEPADRAPRRFRGGGARPPGGKSSARA